MNGSGGVSNVQNCSFFGGIPIKKNERKCQGIKYCQFGDPNLVNQEHSHVDFDSEIFQCYLQQQHDDSIKANTYS
jgi:hypothetical protein